MYLIAEQQYVKVERIVSSISQIDTEHQRTMYLYNEKLVTKHREFPIQDVTDMSYRSIGGKGGLLYVHTTNGVYSYTVKTSPLPFLNAFKKYVKK
ncbi:hypothetical protein CUC15_18810 [Oceanobacillus zhaokaii]|uniref:Bacterial Pleckstrin homology domain-containing protein n=1 Tax=Oceanobacillus zhaokaii TaxID=2052660 RepID=A0A345PLH1_9BACI|nr:hypothetical protein [Oceanobacillus zhaokaii]AXI10851.1 hypothetical protein CUC15_18810 [Oceanobacillus zhaokaii]